MQGDIVIQKMIWEWRAIDTHNAQLYPYVCPDRLLMDHTCVWSDCRARPFRPGVCVREGRKREKWPRGDQGADAGGGGGTTRAGAGSDVATGKGRMMGMLRRGMMVMMTGMVMVIKSMKFSDVDGGGGAASATRQ